MDIYKSKKVLEYTREFDNIKGTASAVAIDVAITALEKQIPKLVEVKAWSPAICPTCGHKLSEHEGDGYYKHPKHLKRCPNIECGQRIKWCDD